MLHYLIRRYPIKAKQYIQRIGAVIYFDCFEVEVERVMMVLIDNVYRS